MSRLLESVLDKNDKNKFKPQNVYGHVEIALIQHTRLETEYPDRGRKLNSKITIGDAFTILETEYPDRGRKLNTFHSPLHLANGAIRKRIPR